jgi:hypothetical protein
MKKSEQKSYDDPTNGGNGSAPSEDGREPEHSMYTAGSGLGVPGRDPGAPSLRRSTAGTLKAPGLPKPGVEESSASLSNAKPAETSTAPGEKREEAPAIDRSWRAPNNQREFPRDSREV